MGKRGSGRIAGRSLDEVVIRRDHEPELRLRWCSGGRETRRKNGKAEVGENGGDDVGVGDECDHAATTRATIALQDIDLMDSAEELSPGEVTRSQGHGGSAECVVNHELTGAERRAARWARRTSIGDGAGGVGGR
jgi:hypothetical protein